MPHSTANVYELPLIDRQVEATSYDSPAHTGPYLGALDLALPKGNRVLSPLDGFVVATYDESAEYGPSVDFAQKANYLMIQHPGNEASELIHLEAGSILVEPGEPVSQGQPIARTGLSGWMTDPHLHWGVFQRNGSEVGFETLKINLSEAAARLVVSKNILLIPTSKEGIVLRQLALPSDDKDYFEALHEDPKHIDNHGNNVTENYPNIESVKYARLRSRSQGVLRFGVRDYNKDLFAGTINARPTRNRGEIEVGCWQRPSAGKNGYMTLGLDALTEYLKPKYNSVIAKIHPENVDSRRLVERVGYDLVGKVYDKDVGIVMLYRTEA